MGKYFGTDGFRGKAGITLTADHAYKVGRFLGWYYNMIRERNNEPEPARIVSGKDTRRSYMFEYSLVAGLTVSGADVYLLHVVTTPSVTYIACVDDFDCGIMISASHNPFYDNGIKLIDCYGEKMPKGTLLLVEDYLDGKLHVKVRKFLITAGFYQSDTADVVQQTFQSFRTTQDYKTAVSSTMAALHLSRSSVTSYLPYEKLI